MTMSFDAKQTRKLRAELRPEHIRTRTVGGQERCYLEGWHVIAEANRIFGYDGWERETLEIKCVFTKQNGNQYSAAYISRVRVSVLTNGRRIVREGAGAGEATTDTPGQAHEFALKAAETDAMKRALVTFGNQFGLSLYGSRPDALAPDRSEATQRPAETDTNQPPAHVEEQPKPTGRIEKSELAISVPRRIRDGAHLRHVASQPCVVCGKGGSHAHHITFAQPRAFGRKVSDEFTVPLCPSHHRQLHLSGSERDWWDQRGIDSLAVAKGLWHDRIILS